MFKSQRNGILSQRTFLKELTKRPKTNNNLNITKQWLIRRMENERLIKLAPGNRNMTPTLFRNS